MQEKKIRIIFIVSLCLKAFGALLQLGFGALLFLTGKLTLTLGVLATTELLEDPNDFIALHVSKALSHVTPDMQFFGAAYLLSHGLIKIFLVWALIKNKLWAYPASLAIFSLFILYQAIHITRGNWIFFSLFITFEVFLLALIWHEYRYLLRKRHIPLQ